MNNKNPRKKTSFVWKYFSLSIGNNVALCQLCDYKRTYQTTTTVFRNHLQNQHNINENKDFSSVKRRYCDISCSSDNDEDSDLEIIRENSATMSPAKNSKIDRKLTQFITANNQAATLVECDEFKSFCKEMCPNYKLPCRQTITNTLLPSEVHHNIGIIIVFIIYYF
jgi:hypothetical protein